MLFMPTILLFVRLWSMRVDQYGLVFDLLTIAVWCDIDYDLDPQCVDAQPSLRMQHYHNANGV